MKDITIRIPAFTYSTWLLAIGITLVVIHCALNYYTYEVEEVPWLIIQLFHLDEENNLPTWFSSFLLFNCSAVLFLSISTRDEKYRLHWRVLAIGFLVLCIDEVAGLHESFHTAIDFNWAIPAAGLLTVVGLLYIPFLRALPRHLLIWFVLSGSIYVSGILGIEYLSRDMDEDSVGYGFAVALEESLEMLGAWLFFRTVIMDLDQHSIRLDFQR